MGCQQFDGTHNLSSLHGEILTAEQTDITTPSFNLYLPPLLTLLDHTHTPTRTRAHTILYNYLPLLPQKLILQTGLAEVFEDAVKPTLMFLPNLTPLEESVQLLGGAYQCLVELGTILYVNENRKGDDNQKEKEKEMKYWDRIMRKGVMMGYMHSSEHPAIVHILVQTIGTLIWKMGVHAVKHLKVSPFSQIHVPTFLRFKYPNRRSIAGGPPNPHNNPHGPFRPHEPYSSLSNPHHPPNNN